MDKFMVIWNWILNNYISVFAAITGLFAVAAIIVKMTPTQTDDTWLAKIQDYWNKFVGFFQKKQ